LPPLACRRSAYDEPLAPAGRDEGLKTRGTAATTMERETDLVWAGLAESVTVAVKLAVPLAVGVPEMTPVVGDKLRPAGRAPVMVQA